MVGCLGSGTDTYTKGKIPHCRVKLQHMQQQQLCPAYTSPHHTLQPSAPSQSIASSHMINVLFTAICIRFLPPIRHHLRVFGLTVER